MTKVIVEALEITGQRGIINKGWGGLGNCKFLVPSLTQNSLYFSMLLYKSRIVSRFQSILASDFF